MTAIPGKYIYAFFNLVNTFARTDLRETLFEQTWERLTIQAPYPFIFGFWMLTYNIPNTNDILLFGGEAEESAVSNFSTN
jgi:hypothetical protein